MRDITRESAISTASICHYFKDKEGVVACSGWTGAAKETTAEHAINGAREQRFETTLYRRGNGQNAFYLRFACSYWYLSQFSVKFPKLKVDHNIL